MLNLRAQPAPDQHSTSFGPAVTAAEAAGLTVKLLISLAAWYRNAGDHVRAADLLEIAATRSDSQHLAQEQAALALVTGQPEAALAILTDLAGRKDSLGAWVALGRCHLELGNLTEAAAIAATQTARLTESVTAHQLNADVSRASGDLAAARAAYQAVLDLSPDNVSALAALGRMAVQAGDRAGGLAILERLLALDVPASFGQLSVVATLAELLDQQTRANALRQRGLHLLAAKAIRLAQEVDTALGRTAGPELESLEPLLTFPTSSPVISTAAVNSGSLPDPDATTNPGGAADQTLDAPPAITAGDETPIDPRVLTILHQDFGYEHLRAGQPEVIRNVLAGRDTLAIMPTGAGKSLTFQIPAMLLDGVTLVLSPLIALMKDQVETLPPAIRAKTALINSSQSAEEQRQVIAGIARGDYKMIYAAPERLRQYTFLDALNHAAVSLVVVDEAHCISLWGHDFRPDYLTIPSALRELGEPPLLAVTATATHKMADGIKEGFNRDLSEIRVSVYRPNLYYEASTLSDREEKVQAAIGIARQERGSGIIYVRSRRDAEAIAILLRDRGVSAVPYHAGLDSGTRSQNQDRFMAGQARVVVATTAFGMGVDKADVRFIIHLSPTPSLEAYAQESGRAGRDGQPSRCVMLATKSDKGTLSRMARRDEQNIDTLRRIYAGLKQAAAGTWALVDPDSLLRWQPLDADPDEEPDPRIALGLLAQANLIKRHPDLPGSYTLRFAAPPAGPAPAPDPLWEALLTWLNLGTPTGQATFRTAQALHALGCSPDDLARVISSRPEVTVWDGPRQACFELLPAGADAAARIELVLATMRRDSEQRIQQVMSYVNARRCRHVLLANHLGEGLPRCEDHCDICAPEGAITGADDTAREGPAKKRSATTSEDALVALEAIRSLSFAMGKPGLTKFLLGSVESRVRADRSPYFGRLTDLRKSTVERLLDRLVELEFLEFFVEREFRLLRPTAQGRHATLDDLSEFSPRRAQARGDATTVPGGANGPADDALYNDLRNWRRERAIQDEVPPYVVASDASLRELVEHRPLDLSSLLEVPGFGQKRVEKYGDEIVALIARGSDAPGETE